MLRFGLGGCGCCFGWFSAAFGVGASVEVGVGGREGVGL